MGLRPQTGIVPQPVALTPSLLFAPHPHSHHLQAQAATTKASALTKSATATATEQLEVAKELAKARLALSMPLSIGSSICLPMASPRRATWRMRSLAVQLIEVPFLVPLVAVTEWLQQRSV